MFFDYVSLAINNLMHRKLRSWLTLLGIVIGIAAVISFVSLGNSLEQAITGQFASLSVDRLIVTNAETGFGPPGSTAVKKLTSHDKEIIENVPGVSSVIPRLLRAVKIEYNKKASFSFAASLPAEQKYIDYIYTSSNIKVDEGRLISSGDKNAVVLGSDFKKSLIFNKEIHAGDKIKIQDSEFKVVGILKPSSSTQLNGVVLLPESEMKKILNIEDESDLILVQVNNPDKIEEIASEITKRLRKDRGLKVGEEDFSVQTPLQAISTVQTILRIINLIVASIAGISLLIGTIGVANTMFTSVLERTKEIGIMKSIGAQNKDIFLIFLIESGLLGLFGGLLGTFIGLLLAFVISKAANSFLGANLFSINFNLPLSIFAVVFSLLLGILSGTIPSFRASKMNPVEALRK